MADLAALGEDPNKDRNDPMVPEYWDLGEAVQDKIRTAGYESPQVEGIAVDIHDLLQAADAIRDLLAPAILTATPEALPTALAQLQDEIAHLRWHCNNAIPYLQAASEQVSQ